MFKLIGASVLMLASGLMGMAKYSELSERKRTLSEIECGARKIKNNLRLLCLPLYECFCDGGVFFEKAAKFIAEGRTPSAAVEKAAREEKSLSKEDREIIDRFAAGLMAHDCEGQIANAEHFLSEIKRKTEEADRDVKTKGTLFIKGSLLLGGALVLILI